MKETKVLSAKKIAMMGGLIALNVVLSRFSIHTSTVKIGFAFITLVLGAVMYGPMEAGIIGAFGDVLGWVINPIGPFFPGFTISAFINGIIFGIFLKKKITVPGTCLAVGITQVIVGLGINTYWLKVLYGYGLVAMLPGRALQAGILFLVQTAIILTMNKTVVPQLSRMHSFV